jgi:nucleoside-diphosphate-sugar epimerase
LIEASKNRVLVTGASGFLGRAVVAALADNGYNVRAAVRRLPAPAFGDRVETMRHADFTQSVDWRPLLEGVDTVIHLAGITRSGSRHEIYDRVNRQATAQLADAAAKAGIGHFIFISSIRAQSGPAADHALTEHDAPAPTDERGRSKLAAEESVRTSGVPFTIMRLVPVYGPGMTGGLGLLLRAAASRLPLPIKDFTNRRSLLGIDNFIAALKFVLSTPSTRGEVYVVADPGIPPAVCDVIVTLRQALGRRPFVVRMPSHYLEIPLRMTRLGDLWHRFGGNLRVDPGKLIAAGWHPLHDTRAGLAALIPHLRVRRLAGPPAPDRPRL